MTPPNEVPREEGEWWMMKRRYDGVLHAGKTSTHEDGLWFCGTNGPIHSDNFKHYEWHKIQLPEGWR